MPKIITRAAGVRARQRGFFDFSMPELGIIFVVALVVLGPKKLPPLVQQIGRWVGRARHMARQFKDQLEQEVNSINAVKPVSQNIKPEVGPAAPATADMGVVETPIATPAASPAETPATEAATEAPAPPAAPGSDIHPEAQIYFALNGTEPEVVAQDPYAPQPVDAAAAEQPFTGAPSEAVIKAEPAGEHPTPAPAKVPEPSQPATVEVIFPHDHG